jgi:hypothetical protein
LISSKETALTNDERNTLYFYDLAIFLTGYLITTGPILAGLAETLYTNSAKSCDLQSGLTLRSFAK